MLLTRPFSNELGQGRCWWNLACESALRRHAHAYEGSKAVECCAESSLGGVDQATAAAHGPFNRAESQHIDQDADAKYDQHHRQ